LVKYAFQRHQSMLTVSEATDSFICFVSSSLIVWYSWAAQGY
jgi:hypothetical protein